MYTTQGYGQNISSVFAVGCLGWCVRNVSVAISPCSQNATLFMASGADFPLGALRGGVTNQVGLGLLICTHAGDESMKAAVLFSCSSAYCDVIDIMCEFESSTALCKERAFAADSVKRYVY